MTEDTIFTTAVRAGEDPDDPHGSVAPPIYQSAVFAFPDAGRGADVHEGRASGYFYGRMGTPTNGALEKALCSLEGGEAALSVASGMAAIATALLTLLRAGDRIVAPSALYASTGQLLDTMLAELGVEVVSVDARDPGEYERALTPETRVFYVETPSNPTLQLTDVAAVARIAARHGVTTIVDNTFATPVNQRPLDLGADLVVHSASKYLGGHSDLIGGILVGRRELVERARWHTAKLLGPTMSPLIAWLVLRGLKTLPLRMARHNESALTVARFLEQSPHVSAVHYPGLESHPQHPLASGQMRGFGGVVSFDVGDGERGRRFVDSLELCRLAVSLGGAETLVQHSASMTHASAPDGRKKIAGISDGLVRLSVGLERAVDILADLERGFGSLARTRS